MQVNVSFHSRTCLRLEANFVVSWMFLFLLLLKLLTAVQKEIRIALNNENNE